jgi:DNA-damage-inducible protein J
MAIEALIETHIDETIRQKAELAFAAAGLTIDQAIQRLLLRAADQQVLPLELYNPNAETLQAMEELRQGGGKTFPRVADLMADLQADD